MALPEEVVHEGKRLKRQDTPYGAVYRDPETGRVYLPEELGLKEEGEEPVIEIGEPAPPEQPAQPPPPPEKPPEKKPAEAAVEKKAEKKEAGKKKERPKPAERIAQLRKELREEVTAARKEAPKKARRAAKTALREMRDAFFASGVYFPLALRNLSFATAYTILVLAPAVVEKYLYGLFGGAGVGALVSIMTAPIHFLALTSITLLAAAILLTIVRVWRGRGLRRGVWTVNLVEAVAFTVMAALLAWLCRSVWLLILIGMGAGFVANLMQLVFLALAPLLPGLLSALGLLTGAGFFILLVLLFLFLPFVLYFALTPFLLFLQLLFLAQQTKELMRSLDLGLVIMLGLFALLRLLAPGLAAAGAVAAVLLAGILAVSTGDIGWLRLIAAVVVVWWAPLEWGLEDFLEPVYRAYVELIGTPGAEYGYRMLVWVIEELTP